MRVGTYQGHFGRADGFNLGTTRFPNLPQYLVIQDRGTGTWYVLRHTADGVRLTLTPEDEIDDGRDIYRSSYRYPAYAEPTLGTNANIRLIVRDGRLGYDFQTLPNPVTDRSYPRLLTRRGRQRRIHEVVEDVGGTRPKGRLGYNTVLED